VAVCLELRENAQRKWKCILLSLIFCAFVDFSIAAAEVVVRELVVGGTLRFQGGGDNGGGAYVDMLMKREPPNATGAPESPVSRSMPIVRDLVPAKCSHPR
jgi:hypothetical protein